MPEKTSEISFIQVQNRAAQNASQVTGDQNFGNNLPLKPSIADLNRITVPSPAVGGGVNHPQPAFGVHMREAVAIVKDWMRG